MFLPPLVPCFLVSIFFHERAEKRVIHQPRSLGFAESVKACRVCCVFLAAAREIHEGLSQEIDFESADAIMLYRTFAQLLEIVLRDDGVEVFLREILGRAGGEVKCRRLKRDCADRIVRTMIAPHFIDR